MADFLQGFARSFDVGMRARAAREELQLQIDEREAARLQRDEHFRETLKQRQTEFEALQQHRGAQEGRAQHELTLRELGLGLQAEGIDVQREGLEQRDQEFDAMERWRASQKALEEKRIEIQRMQADKVVAEGIMTALNPKTAKSARVFGLTHLARSMQIDPKSPQFQDMLKMVNGLEDENLKAMTESLSSMIPGAKPGEITAFAHSVLNGDMTVPQVTEAMKSMTVQKNREKISADIAESAKAPDKAGAIQEHRTKAEEFARAGMFEDARTQLQLARDIETGKEFDPATRGKIKGEEKAAELEVAKQQPVSPSVMAAIGMKGEKLTRGAAADLGIQLDILDDPKQTVEVLKRKSRTQTAMKNIDGLVDFIGNDSELIGTLGAMSRTVESILEQIKAVPSLFDSVVSGDKDEFASAEAIQGILRKGLAGKSAVVRSRILDLSYEIATAREDGRLSDQDVQRALAGIGDSGSAPQLRAVLGDLKDRLRSGTAQEMESITGMRPIDLMTKSELQTLVDGSDSVEVVRAAMKEAARRGK